MKRIIFTIYDDIELNTEIDKAAAFAISQYFDKLVNNKKDYAESIGAEFKFYHNTLSEAFNYDDTAFTNSNLYKHHLFATLADQYDQVMYVDMDVLFNTTKNVFEEIDLSKGIAVKDQDDQIISKDVHKALMKHFGKRNPTLKYHITKDLLDGRDNHVINTGIMIGNSEHIKLLKYVDRLPEIVKQIENKRANVIEEDRLTYIRNFFYPNNEAIFSYILEQYNIPYQLLDDTWHDIRDDKPKESPFGDAVHFINKRFNAFFNDKSKVIYSLYIKIDDDNLDNPGTYAGDKINKSKRTQLQLEKYYDRLVETKKQYAESIGADFILFERDDEYLSFAKKYSYMSEYNIVNLYKIYLLDKLCNQYDYALYLDFDVYCRKPIDIFNILNCDYFIQCQFNTSDELKINNEPSYIEHYNYDFRSPHSKYWNAHALLNEYDLEPDNFVFNTGIVAASKNVIQQLNYFGDLDEVLDIMTDLQKDSMYPPQIQNVFGYDNETIFSFKVVQNNVPHRTLDNIWHFKHYASVAVGDKTESEVKQNMRIQSYKAEIAEKDPIFVHFISKQFELEYD